MNVTKFGATTGIPVSTLKKYESDNSTPGGEAIQSIVKAGINAHWLLTGHGSMLLKEMPRTEYREGSYVEKADDFVYVDTLKIEAAAGHGAVVEHEIVSSRMAFRRDWIEKENLKPSRLSVIRARGDSMQPTLMNGDTLLVETYTHEDGTRIELGLASGKPIPQDGLYVLRLEGGLMVKRLQLDMAGGLYVKSDNPAYQQLHIPRERLETITIAGKVVWIGRRI